MVEAQKVVGFVVVPELLKIPINRDFVSGVQLDHDWVDALSPEELLADKTQGEIKG